MENVLLYFLLKSSIILSTKEYFLKGIILLYQVNLQYLCFTKLLHEKIIKSDGIKLAKYFQA